MVGWPQGIGWPQGRCGQDRQQMKAVSAMRAGIPARAVVMA